MTLAAGCGTVRDIGPMLSDPCLLLSKEDIRTVQAAEPRQSQENSQRSGGVTVAQCFYTLPDFARSVVIELTVPDQPGKRAVADLWKQRFSARDDREEEQEEERKSQAPRWIQVSGVGRQARWAGNRVSGALYVLSRRGILRISVGGAGSVEEKIAKTRDLARRALRRME